MTSINRMLLRLSHRLNLVNRKQPLEVVRGIKATVATKTEGRPKFRESEWERYH